VPEISAYHEAGHALMAFCVGARVRSITIDPDRDDGPERHGDAQIEWPVGAFSERELCEKSILVALAGPVAEMIYSGEPFHPGLVSEWAADWSEAWAAAAALFPNERRRLAYLEQITVKLYKTMKRDDRWAALAAIVDNLVAHETLEGEQVEKIVEHWLR
jgi:ATP-dependent Zn protease